MSASTYVAITPVRSDRENLLQLGRALESQTTTPALWVIVDNGSTDGTPVAAREIAARLPWVRVLETTGTVAPEPGAPIVRAFHAGLDSLDLVPDIVVKLDADVSMDPDYFERQLAAFALDERLGIASGTCLEQENGEWRAMDDATEGHVRGAVRAYRWACLQEVLPLPECVGWDGIDELKATMLGWRTRMLPDLAFYHYRRVGRRDRGRTARWRAEGQACWFMGYRASYLMLRALYWSRRDIAALTMITAYVAAALRRDPRYEETEVRTYLRRRQRMRDVLRRAARATSASASR